MLCVIVFTNIANENTTFVITDTEIYVAAVTLSTQDNSKLLRKLQFGFKRVINWYIYLSKPELVAQNPNLNHLVEPSFQGVNRHFLLAFEYDTQRTSAKGYYLPNAEMKAYNINDYDYDYPYFKDNYKMIAVDLSKQQALNADPRAIQQINFIANLDRDDNTRIYFILEEAKETILDFSQGTVKVL